MLYGIGCDLCQIDRVQKLLAGPHGPAFVRRVFGPEEQAALELTLPLPSGRAGQRLAGRAAANFAAKEAFLKAAGTGLSGPFALREIQALRLPSGQPEYQFCGGSAQWMAQHQLQARLSLRHDGGMALAFCTLEPCGETCPAPPHTIKGNI